MSHLPRTPDPMSRLADDHSTLLLSAVPRPPPPPPPHSSAYRHFPMSIDAKVESTVDGVCYIANHIRHSDEIQMVRFVASPATNPSEVLAKQNKKQARQDWKYVAMVLDRLFLIIFSSTVSLGTAIIILGAPSLWDRREPVPHYCEPHVLLNDSSPSAYVCQSSSLDLVGASLGV